MTSHSNVSNNSPKVHPLGHVQTKRVAFVDLEWKLTYVGSPDSTKHDQVLDSIMVGPIPVGVNRFQFAADPPQAESIPASDILGVTVILLTCAYDDKEFIRVGYYQNNEYPEGSEERRLWEEKLEKKEKITSVDIPKVVRNILADKPKVTRFNIKWYGFLEWV